jgi:hypothetical protein
VHACDRRLSGYKAMFECGVTEVGGVAHTRRKCHELRANHESKGGEQALRYLLLLFKFEVEVASATAEEPRPLRQRKSCRVAAALHLCADPTAAASSPRLEHCLGPSTTA